MNPILSILALAYVSQTVGKVTSSLLPVKKPGVQRLIRDWASTSMGVTLAFAAQADILADIGVDLNIESLGYLATGLIVGHGVSYTMAFLSNAPWKKPSSSKSS